MQRNNDPERTGHIYFGIFLMLAIVGGWVIWRSNQWYEAAERRRISPYIASGAESPDAQGNGL